MINNQEDLHAFFQEHVAEQLFEVTTEIGRKFFYCLLKNGNPLIIEKNMLGYKLWQPIMKEAEQVYIE